MIVEAVKHSFTPVVIKIETKEELINLWHKLNATLPHSYKQEYPDSGRTHDTVNQYMWEAVDCEVSNRKIKV